jgi:MFS transporter, DHA2 family, metal-tetracycline-proton antiporter
VLGNPLLGALQDKNLDQRLAVASPALHGKVAEPAQSKFGFTYQPLDKQKVAQLSAEEQTQIETIRSANNQSTLAKVAVLPSIMLVCYIGLIFYFRLRGGYRPVEIQHTAPGPLPQPSS